MDKLYPYVDDPYGEGTSTSELFFDPEDGAEAQDQMIVSSTPDPPVVTKTEKYKTIADNVASGSDFMSAWRGAFAPPEEPNRKRATVNQSIAALGDMAQILGSIFAVSGGAPAPQMTPMMGNVAKQQLQDWYIYDQKKRQYEAMRGNAMMQAWQYKEMEKRQKASLSAQQEIANQKMAWEAAKFNAEIQNKRELEAYRGQIEMAKANLANKGRKEAAYISAANQIERDNQKAKRENSSSIYTKSWGVINIPDRKLIRDNIGQLEGVLKKKNLLPVEGDTQLFGIADPAARQQARYNLIFDAAVANIEDPDIAKEVHRITGQERKFKLKRLFYDNPIIEGKKGISGEQFLRYNQNFQSHVMARAVKMIRTAWPEMTQEEAEQAFIDHINETTEVY